MNIVFYLLILLGLIGIWFCLTFAFKPVGKIVKKVVQDAVDTMTEDDENNNPNENVVSATSPRPSKN